MFSLPSIYSEIKQSLRLSIPLVAAQLIYGLSGFVATMMVARLGPSELAANALGWVFFITLILFFIGILSAGGILVAQSFGAKDINGIRIACSQGFILALLFVIPMIAITWSAPYLLALTGQKPEIIKLTIPFFHAIVWVMIPGNILFVLEYILTGLGRSHMVLFMSLIEVPLDIFCFYIFIFGKFGLPACGLAGIGYGLTTAFTLTILVVASYLYLEKSCRKYFVFKKIFTFNKKFLLEIIRVGAPMGGMFCIEVALFAMIALLMGKLGTEVLAAHQIAYQSFGMVLTILWGLSQGTANRVGHEVGRNNRSGITLVAYVNIGIGLCIMFLIAFVYWIFPKYIISFDLDINAAKYQLLITYAVNFLAIAAVLQMSDCCRIICSSTLRALKDTKFLMYISLVSFWLIAFPAAYLLGFVWHLGGAGIWWGLTIGLACAAVILLLRLNWLVPRVDLVALVTK